MSEAILTPAMPPAARALYEDGVRRHGSGDLPGALRSLQEALRLCGGSQPDILEALAVVAADGGDLRAAEQLLRHVQALRPAITTDLRLAITLYKLQRFAEAVPLFERTFPHIAFNADLYEALSFALENTGDFTRSLALREEVLARAPTALHAGKLAGTLLRHAGYERLAQRLRQLLAQFPGDPGLLEAEYANVLGLGDYRRGHALMRARRALLGMGESDARLTTCTPWDGQPFAGTLLVSLENHVGEEIMVSSLLQHLERRGQRALVEVDVRFITLFSRSFPALEFVDRRRGELGARFAAGGEFRRANSLDLAQLFDRQCVFPGTPGWLRADPARVAEFRRDYDARWPGRRRIGISWRSARPFNGIDAKSIALADLQQTLATPDTVFVSLQYGDAGAELAGLATAPFRDERVDAGSDFDALAAQVAALDRVVTVSNVTAHLAGALGVPTTVLLPKRFPVLWHWGYHGEETTWYGAVRLLRNPREQGWAELDGLLAADLRAREDARFAGPDTRRVPS
jgi:tetratricopeptide (TPR) repeat protein